MARKGGLGSGLEALFGDEIPAASGQGESVPISKVEPREGQPRIKFDEDALAELAESIESYGILQPITVRKLEGGYYQIIAGERRWRAARIAGLKEVPVQIIEADDRRAMELALVENLQREDLDPIEEARGYRHLMDDFGLTQEEAAQAVGKSRPAVANSLRLLTLGKEVLSLVSSGDLSAGHARALIPLKDPADQLQAALAVVKKQLSVRETENFVSRLTNKAKETQEKDADEVNYAREVEKTLENALGRKVKLVNSDRQGKIELQFYGADDRENLIEDLLLFGRTRRKR